MLLKLKLLKYQNLVLTESDILIMGSVIISACNHCSNITCSDNQDPALSLEIYYK